MDTLGVSAWFVLLTVVAAVNPAARRVDLARLRPASPSTRACGAAIAFVAVAVLALVSERLLDALDVSAPTARVAAGLVLLLRAMLDVVGADDDLWPSPVAHPPAQHGPPDPTAAGPTGHGGTGPAINTIDSTGTPGAPDEQANRASRSGDARSGDARSGDARSGDARSGGSRRALATARRGAVPVAFPVLFRPESTLLVVAFAGSDRTVAAVAALAAGFVLFTVVPPSAVVGRRGRATARSTALVAAALAVGTVIGGVLDV
jgi:small neutral amino acid transporter SnatA (MarC family)